MIHEITILGISQESNLAQKGLLIIFYTLQSTPMKGKGMHIEVVTSKIDTPSQLSVEAIIIGHIVTFKRLDMSGSNIGIHKST